MATVSGPGKAHRKGITLMGVVKQFDTEENEAWFVEQRWPDGNLPVLPVPRGSRPSRKPQPFRCRACRKDVNSSTVLHSSNIMA